MAHARCFQPTHLWEGDRNTARDERFVAKRASFNPPISGRAIATEDGGWKAETTSNFQPTHLWEGDRNAQDAIALMDRLNFQPTHLWEGDRNQKPIVEL